MSTGDERLEVPSGSINGTNRIFTTSTSYEDGTLRVWHNGILIREGDLNSGWTPVSSTQFETLNPFRTNDTIHCRYIEQ